MDNTIIQQGSFVSTGKNITIPLRSGVDWMTVYNYTQGATAQVAALGVKFYWQYGFPDATAGWVTLKSDAANADNLEEVTTNCFRLVDTSNFGPGIIQSVATGNDITAISGANPPVVTNAGANGLIAGSVVRMFDTTGALQVAGIDFTVGINTLTGTEFSLDYMVPIAAAAGMSASWTVISYGPSYWYPPYRYITDISNDAQAIVTLSVTHNYTVGQAVRFNVSPVFGMPQINGLLGNIVDIDLVANTITVDINTTGFGVFLFPVTADVPFTPATVNPVGENTALANALGVNPLDDATVNTALIGMNLTGGAGYPGGAEDDVMFWVAGKSFNGGPSSY